MPPPLPTLLTLPLLLALAATLLLAATLRLLAILPGAHPQRPRRLHPRSRRSPARLLVVLGSGGHTHEMLALLRGLDTRKYGHRTYVVSSGDGFSAGRARAFERGLEEAAVRRRGDADATGVETEHAKGTQKHADADTDANADANSDTRWQHAAHLGPAHYTIHPIPRARAIHQPLLTTPLTALRTLLAALPLLCPRSAPPPDLILTNGPATSAIIILAALILRFFNVRGVESGGLCRTLYVESFARVNRVSLSGRLVVRGVDRFVVQWEGLEGYGGRAEYGGVLVG
ncbi:oligosaccharide biosynthesis protein Alg14 like-domain-containing protein [Boeremia exigua]|uniref:oligosaccharide biosynthesis protein Alg14 like-domain-containing protein n=1 Tax=Boeremia exigua TaxID=749465 RepID=UPI001E8D2786|nr:oligosaccharide biosynthesis protein Alg14 like-domain-containing protein [Boeremia exigua]KAH6639518.1 oligosaccharide biosynthesis protein Alg14 like-domain-containing protein [Boeremia exigua]